jgi:hypothetical protein
MLHGGYIMSDAFFVFDIETLGVESTSVILSLGMVYCDPSTLSEDNNEAYKQLMESSIFVKFKAKEQTSPATNRTISKDTLDWWGKQGAFQKQHALEAQPYDVYAVDGLKALAKWYTGKEDYKNLPIWTRGGLDQLGYESLCRTFEVDAMARYNVYRDVRTAIDLIYEKANGGYVDIPGFDVYQVAKHHPVHDSAYDALMLLRGVQ